MPARYKRASFLGQLRVANLPELVLPSYPAGATVGKGRSYRHDEPHDGAGQQEDGQGVDEERPGSVRKAYLRHRLAGYQSPATVMALSMLKPRRSHQPLDKGPWTIRRVAYGLTPALS